MKLKFLLKAIGLVAPVLVCSVAYAAITDIDVSILDFDTPQKFSSDYFNGSTNLGSYAIPLFLQNTTNEMLMINWNKSAYIDDEKISHKVVPGETRVIDMTRTVPETIVPPQTKIEIWVFPVGYWHTEPFERVLLLKYPTENNIFGQPMSMKPNKSVGFAKFAQMYEGKKASLLINIQVGDAEPAFYRINYNLDYYKTAASIAEGNPNLPQQINIGLKVKNGVVESIDKGGLAEKAGLLVGDKLKEMNLKPWESFKDPLLELKIFVEKGRGVVITYVRNGKTDIAKIKK